MSALHSAIIAAVLVFASACAETAPLPVVVPVPSIESPSSPRSQDTSSVEAAPMPSIQLDTDNDGIVDAVDACPSNPGLPHPDPRKHGCPLFSAHIGPSIIPIQPTIRFSHGNAGIAKTNEVSIADVAQILKDHPDIETVQISGHAATGEQNPKHLSEMRANAVLKALTASGVDAARLVAVALGDKNPVADNATEEGRAKNRSVDFKILSRSESSH